MKVKLLVIACFMLLSFCGCSGTNDTPLAEITITPKAEDYGEPLTLFLAGTGSIEDEPLYILAMEFMETYPGAVINADYLNISRSVSENSIAQKISQSNEGHGADIVAIDSNVSTDMLEKRMPLANLSEMMAQDESFNRSNYFENILNAVSVNDQIFVMPLEAEFTFYALNRKYQSLVNEVFERNEAITFSQMLDMRDYIAAGSRGMRLLDCSLADGVALALDMHTIRAEEMSDFNSSAENRELLHRWIESQSLGEQPTVFKEYRGIRDKGAEEAFLDYSSSDFIMPSGFAGSDGEIYFSYGKALAMNENCKNKTLAWKFIRFCADYEPVKPNAVMADLPLILPINRYGFSEAIEAFFIHIYEKNASDGSVPPKRKDEAILDACERVTAIAEMCTKVSSLNIDTSPFTLLFIKPLSDYLENTLTFDEMAAKLDTNIREYY